MLGYAALIRSHGHRDDVDAERSAELVVRSAAAAGCIIAMYGACVVTAVRISGGSIEMRCKNQAGKTMFQGVN